MAREYTRISQQTRDQLIALIEQSMYTIKAAAAELRVPYENAKAIYRIFKKQNRSEKKISKWDKARTLKRLTSSNRSVKTLRLFFRKHEKSKSL